MNHPTPVEPPTQPVVHLDWAETWYPQQPAPQPQPEQPKEDPK